MASTTIRRNSRELRDMWEHATRAISYTLENGFVGEDVTVEGAREWYTRIQSKSTFVSRQNHGYRIHYHSNHWTDLLVPTIAERRGGDCVCVGCGRPILTGDFLRWQRSDGHGMHLDCELLAESREP